MPRAKPPMPRPLTYSWNQQSLLNHQPRRRLLHRGSPGVRLRTAKMYPRLGSFRSSRPRNFFVIALLPHPECSSRVDSGIPTRIGEPRPYRSAEHRRRSGGPPLLRWPRVCEWGVVICHSSVVNSNWFSRLACGARLGAFGVLQAYKIADCRSTCATRGRAIFRLVGALGRALQVGRLNGAFVECLPMSAKSWRHKQLERWRWHKDEKMIDKSHRTG
jgi:hypothetical protein